MPGRQRVLNTCLLNIKKSIIEINKKSKLQKHTLFSDRFNLLISTFYLHPSRGKWRQPAIKTDTG